jgi:hypothetical protein
VNKERNTSELAANWLRRHGLGIVAAGFLEAFRSLTYLGAQALFLVEPVIGGRNDSIQDFARLLEDPDQVDDLIHRLRMEADR